MLVHQVGHLDLMIDDALELDGRSKFIELDAGALFRDVQDFLL